MEKINYKYDVAFSFLSEDEDLAQNLHDVLSESYRSFIYTAKQAEIAGKDGEVIFNRVFGKEAELVVVLYRENWGKTKWTRIEMTAIRNRAFEEGYDFTLFVPIGNVKILLEWLPKTRIWLNFERFGIDGIISTIRDIINREEEIATDNIVEDKIAQIAKAIDANKSKDVFLDSDDGVKAARIELTSLFDCIEKLVTKIESDTSHIKIKVDRDAGGNALTFLHKQYYINIEFFYKYGNTLDGSSLYICLWERPSIFSEEKEQTCLTKSIYNFDVSLSQEFGWTEKSSNKFYKTDKLAELVVLILLDKIDK